MTDHGRAALIPVVTCPACGITFQVETPPAALDAARLEERRAVVAWLRAQAAELPLLSRGALMWQAMMIESAEHAT